jgi:hypothetical protein
MVWRLVGVVSVLMSVESIAWAGGSGSNAVDDTAATPIDTPVAIDVLANDTGSWVKGSFDQPEHGAVTADSGGLVYLPDPGFQGEDSFGYRLTDTSGAVCEADVSIIVATNPTATDDVAGTLQDTPVSLDLLANDVGEVASASTTPPANGSLAPNGPALVYTPAPGFVGNDGFSYTFTDPSGASTTAAVAISVTSPDARLPTLPLFPCKEIDEVCNLAQSAGFAGDRAYGRGAAFVDIDGDGFDDIFVADTDDRHDPSDFGVSKFYRNRGDGTFEFIDVGLQPEDILGTWVGAFGDYDNDGDPDVLFGNGGYTEPSSIELYENRMNETGQFVPVTASSGVDALNVQLGRWWGAAWADYDEDGLLDVVATRTVGPPVLLHNDGGGNFSEVAASVGINVLFNQQDDAKNPVWIDHDGDGDDDLYLAGLRKHAFYENRGGQFIDITSQIFSVPFPPNVHFLLGAPGVFAAAAADFNQDGADDLYLGRWFEQDLVLFNDGNGNFVPAGSAIGLDALTTERSDLSQPYENTMGLGVGDLFDDGFAEVFIGSGDPVRADADIFYCNDGTSGFVRCTEVLTGGATGNYRTRGHGTVFADIDHDGDTDMFYNPGGHPEWDDEFGFDTREEKSLFVQSPKNPHNTATLTLEGTASNRDAYGARVQVDVGSRRYYYALRSTQGFQSQNSKALVLNLDQSPSAQVEVFWPSGQATELTVSAGERRHVVE